MIGFTVVIPSRYGALEIAVYARNAFAARQVARVVLALAVAEAAR